MALLRCSIRLPKQPPGIGILGEAGAPLIIMVRHGPVKNDAIMTAFIYAFIDKVIVSKGFRG